jgi:molybdopterin-guanine dinucleotide biosynthesis protein MobB
LSSVSIQALTGSKGNLLIGVKVMTIPVLGIVATRSNSGKTTLLERLIQSLADQGVSVSVVKHVHHDFDLESPGKDSFRFRQAGSVQVMVASEKRWGLLSENRDPAQYPDLNYLIAQMDLSSIDLLLVEGLKESDFPKIEVSLEDDAEHLLCHQRSDVIAVATKSEMHGLPVPRLDIDDVDAVTRFVLQWLGR